MFRKYLLTVFFLASAFGAECRLPEIEPQDVTKISNEILKAHVNYDDLTPLLSQRILSNFIEDLDPVRAYFTFEEVASYLEPSDEQLSKVVEAFKLSDFSLFYEIHRKIVRAIERRRGWEPELANKELPQSVSYEELKSKKWPADENELFERLVKVRAFQMHTAEDLDEELKSKYLRRVEKSRSNFEEELLTNDPIEKKRLILSHILKATASSMDAHTAYLTPGEANQFLINVQQRLTGIGARLSDDMNGFSVVEIISGGPADLGGELKEKDSIIAVDGEPVVGMDIADAVELIRGEEGTPVVLTVMRKFEDLEKGSEKLEINVTRGVVVLKETRLESNVTPFGDGVIAQIRLFSFYQDPQSSSASDVFMELERLKKEHLLKGVILDLRNNSGGLLPQAVEVAGLFVTKGIVVTTKDGSGALQHWRDSDGKVAWEGPLLVLTNVASASASEIVAQTLQDYGRAIVVGDEQTFGKGTYQNFTLDTTRKGGPNPQGEYKVTRGIFYTVSGKSPQLTGVSADVWVPSVLSKSELGERFEKYPLDNDQIEANFSDDLADIPLAYRSGAARIYRFNLQEPLQIYTKHLGQLRQNSEKRREANKNYQALLKTIEKKTVDSGKEEEVNFGKNDLQLEEAINVMKDLVILMSS